MTTLIEEKNDTEVSCPYCSIETDIYVCRASLTSQSLGNLLRSYYCNSENYDNCAIFLAKILRRR
jgi:redox-regulated HSP33 family molecular chaperone